MKRRTLNDAQSVVIVYTTQLGFINKPAVFLKYQETTVNGVTHSTPMFEMEEQIISGMDCFWALPDNIRSLEDLHKIQFELISTQISAIEAAHKLGQEPPIKIKDVEIINMAKENIQKLDAYIQKLGFDPRDESWIETEMAETGREKNWFAFERKNPLLFAKKWDEMTYEYNKLHGDNLSIEQAKLLSKKRMRYLLGAFYTRQSGNANKDNWKTAAREFEAHHREIENRMLTWSLHKNPNFPLARVIKPVSFTTGPYFHVCIEKIPHVFTDTKLTKIKEGVIVRVVSYDNVSCYSKIDFTPDVRSLIKPEDVAKPWCKDEADYNIWVSQDEFKTHLQMLEKLDH